MSKKRTRFLRTNQGRTFEISLNNIATDDVAEKLLRNYFVRPGSFRTTVEVLSSYEKDTALVLHADDELKKKGCTISGFSCVLMDDEGQQTVEWFVPANDRNSIFFPPTDVFHGLVFSISGRGSRWYKKELLHELIKFSGGVTVSTLNQKVDFLILARNNTDVENAKIAYAKKHGIVILSPRELMALWISQYKLRHPEENKVLNRF